MQDFSTSLDSDSDPLIQMYGIGWRSVPGMVPKMGTVTIWETPNRNPNQWKNLCIIQCNDRVWNSNPSPNPNLNPLLEISH